MIFVFLPFLFSFSFFWVSLSFSAFSLWSPSPSHQTAKRPFHINVEVDRVLMNVYMSQTMRETIIYNEQKINDMRKIFFAMALFSGFVCAFFSTDCFFKPTHPLLLIIRSIDQLF